MFYQNPKNLKSIKGLKIWHSLNEYFELTENTRFKNNSTFPFLAPCTSYFHSTYHNRYPAVRCVLQSTVYHPSHHITAQWAVSSFYLLCLDNQWMCKQQQENCGHHSLTTNSVEWSSASVALFLSQLLQKLLRHERRDQCGQNKGLAAQPLRSILSPWESNCL